jgi:ABC-type sugar transport system ATPase subunit
MAHTQPVILILDDPTRGVDVGAKLEIYDHCQRLAAQGMTILLTSSEAEEVLGLSDRVLVLAKGKLLHEFQRGEAAKGELLHTMASASWMNRAAISRSDAPPGMSEDRKVPR